MSLEQTQHRRQAIETIHDIVSAMRAIAAGRIQGAQRALAAARRYQEVVVGGLTAVLAEAPELSFPPSTGRPLLLLVMTSEQPLCGAFNQNVLAFAESRWRELRAAGPVQLAVVGRRGVRQLRARGMLADAAEPAATSLPGLRDVVKRLSSLVDRRYASGEIGALNVIYGRYQSISEQIPTEERVLPMDFGRLRAPTPIAASPPYRYLPLPDLLAGLISEYAFISLYRMAADSFASEQASRLIAMEGATRNTERMLQSLWDLERRERQGLITQQVLELISARFAAEPAHSHLSSALVTFPGNRGHSR
jgi:F-type H+-transporting ATPase subunit gamma